jgi:hypothetical protein
MKYATKFSVVPLVQQQQQPSQQVGEGFQTQEPDEYLVSQLDSQMTSILSQKINLDEKMKLYAQALSKFTNIYHVDSFSLPTVLAEMATKAKESETKLLDKIDTLNKQINVKFRDSTNTYNKIKKEIKSRPETVVESNINQKEKTKKKKKLDVSQSNVITSKRKSKKTVKFPAAEAAAQVEVPESFEDTFENLPPAATTTKKGYSFFPSGVSEFFSS